METQFLNIEYLFFLIYQFLTGAGSIAEPIRDEPERFFLTGIYDTLTDIWIIFSFIMTIVCLILASIFIYSVLRLRQVRKEEEEYYNSAIAVADDAEAYTNTRWELIEQLGDSPNETDWRQAIIEADILLDGMLTTQGYIGISVGDKLKQVEPSDFNTLQQAWDAHKVRNSIAHEGSNFTLTHREAKDTLRNYEQVFREFFFI